MRILHLDLVVLVWWWWSSRFLLHPETSNAWLIWKFKRRCRFFHFFFSPAQPFLHSVSLVREMGLVTRIWDDKLVHSQWKARLAIPHNVGRSCSTDRGVLIGYFCALCIRFPIGAPNGSRSSVGRGESRLSIISLPRFLSKSNRYDGNQKHHFRIKFLLRSVSWLEGSDSHGDRTCLLASS